VEALDPTYGGDLEVGDQLELVPTYTGGLSLAIVPLRATTVTVGIAYVGPFRDDDLFAELSCFGGTGPCAPSERGYIRTYPAIGKANLAVTQRLTSVISVFVSVKNLTNNDNYELVNSVPVQGRVTVAGVQIRY
jgi:hypothetical protein